MTWPHSMVRHLSCQHEIALAARAPATDHPLQPAAGRSVHVDRSICPLLSSRRSQPGPTAHPLSTLWCPQPFLVGASSTQKGMRVGSATRLASETQAERGCGGTPGSASAAHIPQTAATHFVCSHRWPSRLRPSCADLPSPARSRHSVPGQLQARTGLRHRAHRRPGRRRAPPPEQTSPAPNGAARLLLARGGTTGRQELRTRTCRWARERRFLDRKPNVSRSAGGLA